MKIYVKKNKFRFLALVRLLFILFLVLFRFSLLAFVRVDSQAGTGRKGDS